MKNFVMKLPGMKQIFATHLARKLAQAGVSTDGIQTTLPSQPSETPSSEEAYKWVLELPVCRPEDVKPGPNRVRKAYGFNENEGQMLISVLTPPKPALPASYGKVNPLAGETVELIMSRHVPCVQADTPVSKALDAALKRKLQELPVIDQDLKFLGVFSCKDFLARLQDTLQQGNSLESLWQAPVYQQLFSPVPTVTPETALSDAAACLRQYRLRQLYVLQGQKIKGILHADALLFHRLRA